jgi:hypothetical protein
MMSTYVKGMRRRAFFWLVPIVAFLAIFAGSSSASAHPGHVHSVAVTSSSIDNLGASSAVGPVLSHRVSETGQPCDCPAGHCSCTIDCAAACAAAAVVTNGINFQLSWAPPAFELAPVDVIAGVMPFVDLDPPRPIA